MKNNVDKLRGFNRKIIPATGTTNGSSGYYFVSISTRGRKSYFGEVITHNSDMLDLLDKIDPQNIEGVHVFMGDNSMHGMEKVNSIEDFEQMIREVTDSESKGNSLLHLDIEISYSPIGEITRKYWEEIPKLYPYVSLDATILMPDQLHGILRFDTPKNAHPDPNFFRNHGQNLDMVIKGFKGAVLNFAKSHNIEFHWQTKYFDNYLKSEQEIEEVRQYIFMNPLIWAFTNQEQQ
jgi:hypothetical protein